MNYSINSNLIIIYNILVISLFSTFCESNQTISRIRVKRLVNSPKEGYLTVSEPEEDVAIGE